MNKAILVTLLGLSAVSLMACSQQDSTAITVATSPLSGFIEQSTELGQVHWIRDLEQAQQLAKQSGKPLFVQFQEVPG